MAQECSSNCSSCGEDCAQREAPKTLEDFREAPNPGSHIKNVVGVVSGKGGVGKTFVTSLLAVEMQRAGYKVGILDADITGPSVPRAFGITGQARQDATGLLPSVGEAGIPVMSINLLLENPGDPVVWRGPVIAGVVKQFWTDVNWGELDYLFVDLPPGTGDVPLTVFQSLPVDGIVIVTTPQQLVGMIVEKAVKMADLMQIPVLALVENMSWVECPDCNKKIALFGESRLDEAAQAYGIETTQSLPATPQFATLIDAGKAGELPAGLLPDVVEKLKKMQNR